MECKYAQQISQGAALTVLCNACDGVCGYIRYCAAERRYKNAPTYINCVVRKQQLEKLLENKE